jgi:hypothetical protein
VSSTPRREPITFGRVVLERRPDGLHFTLLPPGLFRGARESLFSRLVGIGAWYAILLMVSLQVLVFGSGSTVSIWGLVSYTGFGFVGLVAPFLLPVVRARSSGSISATADLLTIERRDLFWNRRWSWERWELLAIVPGGLWIIDWNDRYYLFPERDRAEMAWVSDWLSAAFDLDNGAPHTLGVVLLQGLQEEPVPARLYTRPGRLTIHCTDSPWPYFRFDATPTPPFLPWPRFFSANKPHPLAPGEASCRIETDGSARLQLTPSGTRFQLTLSCQDGAGLQRALACFWGAADTAEP